MKSISRILAMLVCLALVLSACGGGASSTASSDPSSAPASSGASSAPAETGLKPGETAKGPTGEDIGGGWSDKVATKSDPTPSPW